MTLVLHAAATWVMVGVIWFVQLVHYPLFARVGSPEFRLYELGHTRRTTWIVAPTMLVEAATGALLALRPPVGVAPGSAWLGLALLAVVWLSTALVQVPLHRRLSIGFDDAAQRRLVSTNWVRTTAWTLRGLLALWWLA